MRYLTAAECQGHGWHESALVLLLDDGTAIYPSADDEGNTAGALFGMTREGEELTFPTIAVPRKGE